MFGLRQAGQDFAYSQRSDHKCMILGIARSFHMLGGLRRTSMVSLMFLDTTAKMQRLT